MKEKKDFTFRNCSFEIKRNQFFEFVILKKPFFSAKKIHLRQVAKGEKK